MATITRYNDLLVRADGERSITGTASVTYDGTPGTEYELIPRVWERVAPGAFDKALQKGNIVSFYNHDKNQLLGRFGENLAIRSDAKGLHYTLTNLPHTSYTQDLLALIEQGLVRGSSFQADIGYSRWTKEKGRDVKTIERFDLIVELGPVVAPAYTGTRVALRELPQIESEHKQWLETQIRLEKLRAITNIQ